MLRENRRAVILRDRFMGLGELSGNMSSHTEMYLAIPYLRLYPPDRARIHTRTRTR